MKLTFLGGADGVGASCTLIEMAGHRILVDCGVKQSSKDGDALPALSKVQDAGGIEAIILTHAHIDHSGALPVIFPSYPKVPIYMTTGTHSIVTILLLDAVKIMQMEADREGEVPLYSLPMAEMVIGGARPLAFAQTIKICGGDIQLTFYPAGHIMGAATALLESKDGTLLMSGDIAVTNQLTVTGMIVPRVTPDLVVIESTYGGKLHSQRALEEQKLIDQTAQVIERKGAILFPAFAVGRAQEVILILSQAMEKGELARAPIYVDGMVRQVCAAYTSYADLLSPWFRKRVKRFGNPFFYQDGPAMPIWDVQNREVYANMRPAIFVASSGMLAGGPSQYYAGQLAKDPASFIAITGYQDEESPGRRIQELAQEGGGEVRIGNETVALQCGVGTYKLSAHVDTAQTVGILTALAPDEVALVHGDGGAREALALAVQQAGIERVYLPKVGDELEVNPRTNRRRRYARPLTANNENQQVVPIKAENLIDVAQLILKRDGPGRFYTAQEILIAWQDSEGALNTEEIARVGLLLGEKNSPFKRDHKRFFLYRLRVDSEGQIVTKEDKAAIMGLMDQTSALQQVDQIFEGETGLYKRGALVESNTINLAFHFPKVAQQKYGDRVAELQRVTGWNVTIKPEPHHGAITQAALDLLPSEWPVRKQPSLHLGEEKVVIHLDMELPNTEEFKQQLAERTQQFHEMTGFHLVIQGLGNSNPATSIQVSEIMLNPERMEINASYAAIRQAFQAMPHQPLKTSLKGMPQDPHIEITFISPEVGQRYQELLNRLAQETGWPIRLRAQPDQLKIQNLAKSIIPTGWRIQGEPAFKAANKSVQVKLALAPAAEEFAKLKEKFIEATGYDLTIVIK